jgi:hypothetical protein
VTDAVLATPGAGAVDQPSIDLSLISHTNVGKTTLARTLLRRDIGEVRDEAHVTMHAESHVLIESAAGDVLRLWDTPGFGDSARLLRRLEKSATPIGWFLSQVWDRFTDRPFWSSQQALRNVRDASDLVLYLANAAEDVAAGYLDPELRLLGWIGKPIIVLLNQLGPPRDPASERAEVERWRAALAPYSHVRDVLAFDAFARCWVQEDLLLARIESALPGERRAAFARLREAWGDRNREVFERSMQTLARQLAETALDRESISERTLGMRARAWLRRLVTEEQPHDPELERSMRALSTRLDAAVRRATEELIRLHGLSGRATQEILARVGGEYAIRRAADAGTASVIGGIATGALSGLAADLAAGGLTFGAGALIGGIVGALGAGGLAHAYNLASGPDPSSVRWSPEFLDARVTAALLRYLAVAHFGRGRGEFVASEYPQHWQSLVAERVAARRDGFDELWRSAETGETTVESLAAQVEPVLRELAVELLAALYPDAVTGEFDGDRATRPSP